ncbi:hypothetical protein BDV95DRAFT_446910, partial [Massariosphaeria phaeospora]
LVFFINLNLTIWSYRRMHSKDGVIFEGECHEVSRVNSALHLVINLLGTLLLASSNYCMQCLSAPTRRDIDRSHSKKRWLDIGVPSIRNLGYINKGRVVIWALLALSSLPLHLFYNSMVYSSAPSYDYSAFSVSETFVDRDLDFNNTCDDAAKCNAVRALQEKARTGDLDRLENGDCIAQYATLLQSFHRNLLVIVDSTTGSDDDPLGTLAPLLNIDNTDPYSWICSGNFDDMADWRGKGLSCISQVDELKTRPKTWHVHGRSVQYCLSESAPPTCKLHVVAQIGLLVTILNFVKVLLILYAVFGFDEEPLITMGDAVVSFMEKEDPTTRDLCLVAMGDAKSQAFPVSTGPMVWKRTQHRWIEATTKARCIATFTMFFVAILLVSYLLNMGLRAIKNDSSTNTSLHTLAQMGFGTWDPRTVIRWQLNTIMLNILAANAPQIILSLIYFGYNAFFTYMLLGREWASYAHERKGLRVSQPSGGAQRSTYFLQLPYRFSMPLLLLSGTLHWLVSQSIFLVVIEFFEAGFTGEKMSYQVSCGFSPIAIISVIVLAVSMVLAGIGFGFVAYKPGINLAGSCSAAMSAACQSVDKGQGDELGVVRMELKWGVTAASSDGEVGHCAFSSGEVTFPENGKKY